MEYKVLLQLRPSDLERNLNIHAKEGWVLSKLERYGVTERLDTFGQNGLVPYYTLVMERKTGQKEI